MGCTPQQRFSTWQCIYNATLQEMDTSKLFGLVEVAEAAILTRREALEKTPVNVTELHAIEIALRTLSFIKTDRLKFSSPSPTPYL